MTPFTRRLDEIRVRAFVHGCLSQAVIDRKLEITDTEIDVMLHILFTKMDLHGLEIGKSDGYQEGRWDGVRD